MAQTQEKKQWTFDGEKIKIKNKRTYSIRQLSILSMGIKLLSLALIFIATTRFFTGSQMTALISLIMGALLFANGFIYGKIAKDSNQMYMDACEKESLRKHQEALGKR